MPIGIPANWDSPFPGRSLARLWVLRVSGEQNPIGGNGNVVQDQTILTSSKIPIHTKDRRGTTHGMAQRTSFQLEGDAFLCGCFVPLEIQGSQDNVARLSRKNRFNDQGGAPLPIDGLPKTGGRDANQHHVRGRSSCSNLIGPLRAERNSFGCASSHRNPRTEGIRSRLQTIDRNHKWSRRAPSNPHMSGVGNGVGPFTTPRHARFLPGMDGHGELGGLDRISKQTMDLLRMAPALHVLQRTNPITSYRNLIDQPCPLLPRDLAWLGEAGSPPANSRLSASSAICPARCMVSSNACESSGTKPFG